MFRSKMKWVEQGEKPTKYLRANVSKNQTISNICGNGQKIDFPHTFKFDTLSC